MTVKIAVNPTIESVTNALKELGLREKDAKIFSFVLSNDSGVDQHAIERALDLRQPEVSVALHHLIDQRWVKIAGNIQSGRRPSNIYKVCKTPKEIAADFLAVQAEKSKRAYHAIDIIEHVSN